MAKKASRKKKPNGAPKQAATKFPIPKLAHGERYKGVILNEANRPLHHLILLPGELARATHAEALAHAKKLGGDLPDRAEGALLYANNLDGALQKEWYWLAPQHAGDPGYAWCQYFDGGSQYWGHVSGHCRAVAVRRLSIP